MSTSSQLLSQELEKTFSILIREYINIWYSDISQNSDFVDQLLKIISLILVKLEKRLVKIDWVKLLSLKLPDLIKTHIRDFRSCKSKFSSVYSGGRNIEQLFHGIQPHIAMESSDSECICY